MSLLFFGCPEKDIITTPPVVVDPPAALMPLVNFSDGPYHPGCPISVVGTSLGGATLSWELSDGRAFNTAELNLVFEIAGTYNLTLTATMNGRSEEQTRAVTVVDQETFSEVFQQDDEFTRFHKLLPLADGGSVGYGDYCPDANANGSCNTQGFLIIWYNADGTIRTKRPFTNANGFDFRAKAITVTADGNVAVAYERRSPNGVDPVEGCLMKVGETGAAHWTSTLETLWHLHPRALLETTDGKFVMAGYAKRPSNGDNRAGMYFFSANGTHLENIPFGELNAASRIERLVQKGPNEVIGLMTFSNSMMIANSLNRSVSDLQLGGYTAAALIRQSNSQSFVLSSNGQQVSVLSLGGSSEIVARRTVTLNDVLLYNATLLDNGNLLICGRQNVDNISYGYLAEITPQAELIWEKRRSRQHSAFRGVLATDDCGIFAVGFTDLPGVNNGNNEGYYIKLKPRGEF